MPDDNLHEKSALFSTSHVSLRKFNPFLPGKKVSDGINLK